MTECRPPNMGDNEPWSENSRTFLDLGFSPQISSKQVPHKIRTESTQTGEKKGAPPGSASLELRPSALSIAVVMRRGPHPQIGLARAWARRTAHVPEPNPPPPPAPWWPTPLRAPAPIGESGGGGRGGATDTRIRPGSAFARSGRKVV